MNPALAAAALAAAGVAGVILAAATPAAAEPWRAAGAAAGSVTGQVTLLPDHLLVAGADFPLRLAAEVSSPRPGRTAGQAMIFAVVAPMNPRLINGNRLCGPTPPRWIVAVPIDPNGLEIAVFTSLKQPAGPNSGGVCATYFYNR